MHHFTRTSTKPCLPRLLLLCVLLGTLLTLSGDGAAQETGVSGAATRPVEGAHPGVEAIATPSPSRLAAQSPNLSGAARDSATVTVAGAEWTATGLPVTAGEQIQVTATGTMSLSDGRSSGPAGLPRGWKDLLRQFPLNSANTGALIGRVGSQSAAVPFAVGTGEAVTAPTAGELFLRTNLSQDLSATGQYTAKVHLQAASTAAPDSGSPAPAVADLLRPAEFDPIPRRVSDQAGRPGDMVNFGLLGTEDEVKAAFATAGWVAVDRSVEDAILHGLLSTLNHQSYTEMPMSTLFLFGRPQDLSFARADPLTVAAERHHLRLWRTAQTIGGRPLWVGSATHDIGFERDERTGGTTHKIDPEIDAERGFLLGSFQAAGVVGSAAYVTPRDPLRQANTATGGAFHSDGRILVMDLRPSVHGTRSSP